MRKPFLPTVSPVVPNLMLNFRLVNVELASTLYINVGVTVWIKSNMLWISGLWRQRAEAPLLSLGP